MRKSLVLGAALAAVMLAAPAWADDPYGLKAARDGVVGGAKQDAAAAAGNAKDAAMKPVDDVKAQADAAKAQADAAKAAADAAKAQADAAKLQADAASGAADAVGAKRQEAAGAVNRQLDKTTGGVLKVE